MVNTRAPFRIFAALTFPLTTSAAAHAQTLRTRVSGVAGDARPSGAAEPHAGNPRVSRDGTGIPEAFGDAVRVANSDISFNTASGTKGTVPPYGNNRFAGDGGSSAVTLAGGQPHYSGQR